MFNYVFSVFDTTSFHKFFRFLGLGTFFTFFLVLSYYHNIFSLQFTLMAFKKGTIEHRNVFKGIEYGFTCFDNPLSKNFIEFFAIFFNCRF